jgi:ABC-type transport system involved in multi-copper enzyme maturation permease subunit
MPIFELGYRHWEGKRRSSIWRWLAITRTDAGNIYHKSKLLRKLLFVIWIPLVYFGPLFFAIGLMGDPKSDIHQSGIPFEMMRELFSRSFTDLFADNPELFLPAIWAVVFFFFFVFVQTYLMLAIIAIVAPPLISQDVRSRSFLLYFSKPIRPWDYLLGKLSVILVFIFGITLLPALVLYGISIAFSPSVGVLMDTLTIIIQIILASLVISLPVSVIALLFSSLTKDRRIAAFGWIALWVLGEVAYQVITISADTASQPSWIFLLSIRKVCMVATSAIFDVSGHLTQLALHIQDLGVNPQVLANAYFLEGILGYEVSNAIAIAENQEIYYPVPSSGLAFGYLVGITVVGASLVLRRISKPVRI